MSNCEFHMQGVKGLQSEFKAITHHEAVVDKNEPWNNSPAYDTYEMRFCIVSTETGEILDDV